MKKIIIYSIVCVFIISLVFPSHTFVQASANIKQVRYEEYLQMGYDTENEDCYERAHDSRRTRPSRTLGGMIYDYSHLPDPQDMIFVCINDKFLITDVPIEVENGSTLIPMRALLEAVGASVIWDDATNTVTAILGETQIEMTIDNPIAKVNGAEVSMTVPARKLQGRVYIPLRFVSDHLERPVIWQPNNRIVKVISHPDLSVQLIHTSVKKSTNDYKYTNFFSITERFLLRQNGEIHWLQQWGGEIHVQIFDESFRKKGEITLQRDLQMFGGAHAGKDGNFYLVFAQNNTEESDTKTIYRIVKYDPNWNRIDQVDVKNVHVTKPLHASNLTMDSKDGTLVIYSARERYLAPDGLNHQSNIPIHIRMEDMTVLYDGGEWPRNHVSHSFATYVKFDGDRIIYLDHGDAYPRSIYLQVEESERITKGIDILRFPGEIGDNYTGATVGGLEVSEDHYLVVGTYIQPEGSKSQLFLATVPKHARTIEDVELNYLTGPADPSVTETHLVKMNDHRFVIIWSDRESKHNVSFVVVDGRGKLVGEPRRLEGIAPPGQIDPLVLNDNVIWYDYEEFIYNKEETAEFYKLKIDLGN